MLSEEDLAFLQGWTRKVAKAATPMAITKNNFATIFDLEFMGYFYSGLIVSTDSNVTLKLTLDQDELIANIQDLYNWGYTQPNSSMPYIGAYKPTNGTAGTYTVLWNITKIKPIQRKLILYAELDPDSTQNVAYVGFEIGYYLIYDKTAFMESLKNYLSYVLPKSTNSLPNQPPSSTNNKYNPFEYIP